MEQHLRWRVGQHRGLGEGRVKQHLGHGQRVAAVSDGDRHIHPSVGALVTEVLHQRVGDGRIGHRDLGALEGADHGGADRDLADEAGGVAEFNLVAHLQLPLHQQGEATGEIAGELLQAEADPHPQSAEHHGEGADVETHPLGHHHIPQSGQPQRNQRGHRLATAFRQGKPEQGEALAPQRQQRRCEQFLQAFERHRLFPAHPTIQPGQADGCSSHESHCVLRAPFRAESLAMARAVADGGGWWWDGWWSRVAMRRGEGLRAGVASVSVPDRAQSQLDGGEVLLNGDQSIHGCTS